VGRSAGGGTRRGAEEALEVGGGSDMRGQAVSHWREKGGGELGRREETGRAREAGRLPAMVEREGGRWSG
jgi:hypothetical protein